jgi:hypothetical protein
MAYRVRLATLTSSSSWSLGSSSVSRWVNEAHRPKDREDVRNILAVRGSELDAAYLRRWATEHGTLALLDEIGKSIPPT